METIRRMMTLQPPPNILVVSALNDKSTAIMALRLGARASSTEALHRPGAACRPARCGRHLGLMVAIARLLPASRPRCNANFTPSTHLMASLTERPALTVRDAIKHYLKTTSRRARNHLCLSGRRHGAGGFEYNGLGLHGGYRLCHGVHARRHAARPAVVLQHEHNVSKANLLDAVGEIANTWRAMPRKVFGPQIDISVPACLRGVQTIMARVRKAPRHHLPLEQLCRPGVRGSGAPGMTRTLSG